VRHVKRYQELFEAQTELTPEQIEWLDECTRGKWTLNPQTGLVDVNGGFFCDSQNLTDFKGVRFGVVTRGFDCSGNKLTSLKGAPQEVGENFYCFGNKLTSLKDAPQKVGGSFYCYANKLTSLEGAPEKVVWAFNCSANNITSLKDAPQEVGSDFNCSANNLTSLEGAPKKVGRDFYCYDNPVSESVLKSLYKKMKSGMSWSDAVARQWKYIRSVDDKILLAPYNPNLSPDELKVYQAIGALKRRAI